MKKLNRKLIPAFAMLLLSAVLMSTASFAWFSANGNVTASGFKVTATAPAALWISGNGSSWDSSYSFTGAGALLNPITDTYTENTNKAADADSLTFQILKDENAYKQVDENGAIHDANATLDQNLLKPAAATDYYKQTFYLLLEGAREAAATEGGTANVEKKDVNVRVIINAADPTEADGIYKSIRVAIVCDATDPQDGLGGAIKGYTKFNVTGLGTEMASPYQKLTTIAAQDMVTAYIYIWFEGEDGNCYNANAQHMDEFSISLDFVTSAASNNASGTLYAPAA